MRLAVIQHTLRAHERMDLAALLALAEDASDEGANVIVCPLVPGLERDTRVYHAFIENMRNHAPGSLLITPAVAGEANGHVHPFLTPLGRTVALVGDDCLDRERHDQVLASRADAMIWQPDAESAQQAEAILELALGASLSVAGLIVVAALDGAARGAAGFGSSAIVQLGEILAEAGGGEEVVMARLDAPLPLPDRPARRPYLPPILAERLARHESGRSDGE
jgi:hypothetical protein